LYRSSKKGESSGKFHSRKGARFGLFRVQVKEAHSAFSASRKRGKSNKSHLQEKRLPATEAYGSKIKGEGILTAQRSRCHSVEPMLEKWMGLVRQDREKRR
jgi:hypothetical protein